MLTTNLRSTQTLDPTAVARAADRPAAVTAPAYQVPDARTASVSHPSSACGSRLHATAATGIAATATPWSAIGTLGMSKVDFHNRWPLHSTS